MRFVSPFFLFGKLNLFPYYYSSELV